MASSMAWSLDDGSQVEHQDPAGAGRSGEPPAGRIEGELEQISSTGRRADEMAVDEVVEIELASS